VKHQPRNLTSPEREITAAALGRIHSVLELSRRTPVLRSLDELLRVAAEVASTKRELIYTTVSMDRALVQLVFLRQWFGNLGARARNVLLVGANEHTCQVVREASIPCFADAAAPTQRGRQNGFGSQVTLKWWYARVLAEARFHLIFSDPDVVWLRDPFAHWERSFDFQGLSDIRSVNLTVQSHHEITCMRPWMENMYERSKRSVYPCQSTGLWFARATPPTVAFLRGLHRYIADKPNEWEQKAFQLMVVRYLIGLGDELPPLRYRLLPASAFLNIEMLEARQTLRLPVGSMVGVHCGYLKEEGDKVEHLERHGLLLRGMARHARLARLLRNASVGGFVYTRTQALQLRRKHNSSIRVLVRR